MHLFELEVETLGDDGKLGHVLLAASGMAADEVRDDLLAQATLEVDAVEDTLEVAELLEGRFAHELEHGVGHMFGCHLQSSADMTLDELACVFVGSAVDRLVLAAVEQEVVAHAAAYIATSDIGQGIDTAVDVDKSTVVGIEVRTDGGMYAAGTGTALACLLVASAHAIHVGRRSAEVGEIAFEVGHLSHLLHLAQYALL